MSHLNADSGGRAQLRQVAQQRLVAGIAPSTQGWGISVETLALLHRMASTPTSAADALKLLHELQVHQVELDLQHAQLEANERELTDELARYRALFESAPVAQLVLDGLGQIEHCNRAGAELLGLRGSDVVGRRFDDFLSPDSRPLLAGLFDALRAGASQPSCTVQPERRSAVPQSWQLVACALPSRDSMLLTVSQEAGSPGR